MDAEAARVADSLLRVCLDRAEMSGEEGGCDGRRPLEGCVVISPLFPLREGICNYLGDNRKSLMLAALR